MATLTDFYPNRDADRVLWLQNFRSKLDVHSKELGLAPARLKDIFGRVDALLGSFESKEHAAATYQAAVAAHDELERQLVGELRADIRQLKVSDQCTDGIKADLQIVGGGSAASGVGGAVRPTASVEAHPGFVRVRFKKYGFDGVNVYTRRAGETAWRFLARDTRSPYDDRSPLASPGLPEIREYRVVGVSKDEEQGQPTDAITVTFAG